MTSSRTLSSRTSRADSPHADSSRAGFSRTEASPRPAGVGGRTRGAPPALLARHLTKTYGTGNLAVTALDHVSFRVEPGTFTAVLGPSGSGKSTLMHCLAGLDSPDPRTDTVLRLGPTALTGMSEKELALLRRERVGFVFQSFSLLPVLTARQNILLPLSLAGRRPEPGAVQELAERLGLADRLDHRPDQLSGGQQQRVAIARALLPGPDVVFADEPTGSLDTETTQEVLEVLAEAVRERGQTVLVVTHDPRVAEAADRRVLMRDGRIIEDSASAGIPGSLSGTAATGGRR